MFEINTYNSNDNIKLVTKNKKEEDNKQSERNYIHPEKKYRKLSYIPSSSDNNNMKKKKSSNKRVKFNNKVDIIEVENYKEYNKIDEDDMYNYQDYFSSYNSYFNTKKEKINKKKCNDCICYII